MHQGSWRPSGSDYLEALKHQNPWHELGSVPGSLAFAVSRPMAKQLWSAMAAGRRYQVVLGPRRVGKTVGLHQTVQKLIESGVDVERLWFLRMDHPLLMNHALGEWAAKLVARYSPSNDNPLFLFLDEINYATDWDRWLKSFYDERWPIRVVATSSSTTALRNRTVESGIGRWSEQFLLPYTLPEFLAISGETSHARAPANTLMETIRGCSSIGLDAELQSSREHYLLVGGFPELLFARHDESIEAAVLRSQQVLRAEAVQRVAAMDIPQVFDIRHPYVLERLVYLLAGQICGLISTSNLATTLEITRQTISQYVHFLERAFLVFTLPNYSTSEETVQRQGRKVYFVDGAVRNAALQRGIAPVRDHQEMGMLIENAVAAHLFGLSQQSGMRLYHWRQRKDEVDFIYDDPVGPLAFEVTKSASHSLKGIRALQARYPQFIGRAFLVSAGTRVCVMPEETEDGIGRLPLDLLLIATGLQADHALSARLGATG